MKLPGKIFSIALAALTAAAGAFTPAAASGLTNDPFIRQNTARQNFEPGGKYHLFGNRGKVTDRTGSINITPVYTQRLGYIEAEYARIQGTIGYTTRFSNHPHTEHGPFTNSSSRSASDSKGNIGINLTSYNIKWNGTEIHPADAYDGEQGGGYPAPTGARDEYRYTVSGTAAAMNIRFDDYRSFWERLGNRITPAQNLPADTKQAWDTATTHNPNLNRAGNAVNAAAAGVGNAAGAAASVLGAGDAAQGLGLLGSIGGLESVRALPPAAQIEAVRGIAATGEAVNRAGNAVSNWARNNPNTAEGIKAAANIGGAAFGAARGISHVRSHQTHLVKNNSGLDSRKPPTTEGEMFQTRNVAFKINNLGTKIHDGAQGKHILGHSNYLSGKSTLNRDINPQELLNGIHSGTYPVVSKGARGNRVVDFGRPIGIDGKSGLSTNFGTIHSGKHGVHIVPANPKTIKQVK